MAECLLFRYTASTPQPFRINSSKGFFYLLSLTWQSNNFFQLQLKIFSVSGKSDGSSVKYYYEKNTSKFITLLRNRGIQNIHQPLWVEETFTNIEASNYSNELIRQEILQHIEQTNNPEMIIHDLGCGVGGVVFYLAKKLEKFKQIFGLSISAFQIKEAEQRKQHWNLNSKCTFLEADFHHLPSSLPPADLAYCIEAFVHAYDAKLFFKSVSERLNPGGKLVLIDDFLRLDNQFNNQEKKAIDQFKYGWVLQSLYTPYEVQFLAQKYGLKLKAQKDLTPFLKIYTLKEKLIRLYVKLMKPFLKKSEYFKSLVGGDARQYCLQHNIIKYHLLVFEKEN